MGAASSTPVANPAAPPAPAPASSTPEPASPTPRRAPAPAPNMPAGNSPIEAAVTPSADDALTGDRIKDLQTAVSRIDLATDFGNLGRMPCNRQALLYGIATGAGLGSVRFLGSRSVKTGANWAVATFVAVASLSHMVCQQARAKELAQMRLIQEKFPHRHVSSLKPRAAGGAEGPDSAAGARP